jgi:hypothetical protein
MKRPPLTHIAIIIGLLAAGVMILSLGLKPGPGNTGLIKIRPVHTITIIVERDTDEPAGQTTEGRGDQDPG